jgi:threonine synthase
VSSVNVNLRPYYSEGAKTHAYEIAEQLGWKLPKHIVVASAGGTILLKLAKPFKESGTGARYRLQDLLGAGRWMRSDHQCPS